jgi:uncharacterized protein YndB with AHSA1/START domain
MGSNDASNDASTNRIEKQVTIRAPQARVWRAISDSAEFGAWFGMRLDGKFVAGATLHGKITDPPGFEKLDFSVLVERVEPQSLLSYRWHPYAIDPDVDYSDEPTTLVEFRLATVGGGTQLTVTETGFEHIPAHRRAEALRMNEGGWAQQLERVRKYVEK